MESRKRKATDLIGEPSSSAAAVDPASSSSNPKREAWIVKLPRLVANDIRTHLRTNGPFLVGNLDLDISEVGLKKITKGATLNIGSDAYNLRLQKLPLPHRIFTSEKAKRSNQPNDSSDAEHPPSFEGIVKGSLKASASSRKKVQIRAISEVGRTTMETDNQPFNRVSMSVKSVVSMSSNGSGRSANAQRRQELHKLAANRLDSTVLRLRLTELLHKHRYLSLADFQQMLGQSAGHLKKVLKEVAQFHKQGPPGIINRYSLLPQYLNESEVTWEKIDYTSQGMAPQKKRSRRY